MTGVRPIDATKTHGILLAIARRADHDGMHKLLKPIPAVIANQIRTSIADGLTFSGMRHDAATSAAYFIMASHELVQVTTFRPTTFEQATEIAAGIEQAGKLDAHTAARIYADVTGQAVTIINDSYKRDDRT